jgi:hypothetical protein
VVFKGAAFAGLDNDIDSTATQFSNLRWGEWNPGVGRLFFFADYGDGGVRHVVVLWSVGFLGADAGCNVR